jgi:lysine 6-dehydrogenase
LAQETDWEITAVDLDPGSLERVQATASARTICADLLEDGVVARVVEDADLAVCAVPGFMGFETLKRIVAAGRDVVDISFFSEDALALDDLAKEKGVTAVVDCGVAPGLCNILAGHVDSALDRIERYTCYVGGLPKERQWPYEYKVVFSAVDVLEEYTRPARFIEYGQQVTRPALSDVELIDFPGIGTLEAFNTDGLRSLMRTLNAPFMVEKTLRYPGHADLMRVYRESGFFDTTPVEIDGQTIRPISLTAKLLFDRWKLEPGQEDLTVMQVVVEGTKAGSRYTYTYDLLDRYDRETQTTSMARTTGYTCAIVARQVLCGLLTHKGICPPEYLGRKQDCYRNLLSEYGKRNIQVTETVQRAADDR